MKCLNCKQDIYELATERNIKVIDVSKREEVKKMVEYTISRYGKIDVI